MWVVSQDGYRSLDILGIELVPANDVNEQNQIVRSYVRIIGFGIGCQMILGNYDVEAQGAIVLQDCLSELKRGTQFYDIKSREQKLFKSK